ncbi:hypothetical protein [Leptospira levettii]|uniref:hypothetical protein n=1 Tax=Leptospira levettii TaxID=2023178 RepID=UPI000C29852F|nr:hypothetical protein [Leptospira levettii]PJZ89542.1 hypothetical protein CH368_06175 [Leptospira levettii]
MAESSINTGLGSISGSNSVSDPTGGGFFQKSGEAISKGIDFGKNKLTQLLTDDPTKYIPKKIYSFIISKNGTNQEFEFPLLVGPTNYSETYRYRTSVKPTIGGSVVVDFGLGNNSVRLEGEWYIPYLAKIPSPKRGESSFLNLLMEKIEGANFVNNFKDNLKTNQLSDYGVQAVYRSGIEEYFKIQYLLYHSHFSSKGFGSLFKVDEFTNILGGSDRFNYSEFSYYFVDYDRNRKLEFVLTDDALSISRNTQDTRTIRYSLNLTIVNELDLSAGKPFLQSGQFDAGNIPLALSQLFTDLRSLVDLPLRLQGALISIGRRVNDFINNTKDFVTYSTKTLPKNFADNGKLIGATWDSIVDSIEGQKKKKASERINNAVSDYNNSLAQFYSSLLALITEAEALLGLAGVLTVGGGTSTDELLSAPGSDFIPLIETDLYTVVSQTLWTFIEIQSLMVKASVDTGYTLYAINEATNLYTVADKLFNDSGLAVALASYNKMSSTVIPKGSIIRIPFGQSTNIFFPLPGEPDPIDMEESLLGGDIRLEENRDISVSANGDLGLVFGDEGLANNVLDGIDLPEGSIPFFPTLGNPLTIGEVYSNEEIQIGAMKLLSQIKADTRVADAKLLNFLRDGDTVAYVFQIKSRSGQTFTIQY